MRRLFRHRIPELNTTSTADISFMMLIFFLVCSSMDADKGLIRRLPPADQQQQEVAETHVDKDKVLAVAISADGTVTVNDTVTPPEEFPRKVAGFIRAKGKDHLLTLTTDRRASYDVYFQVQNRLAEVFRQLRAQEAKRLYGTSYDALLPSQRQVVADHVPMRIAED